MPMPPAVTVAVEDATGDIEPFTGIPVTLALNGGSGLGGQLTVTTVNGVATFSNLYLTQVGVGFTLTATASSWVGTRCRYSKCLIGEPKSEV